MSNEYWPIDRPETLPEGEFCIDFSFASAHILQLMQGDGFDHLDYDSLADWSTVNVEETTGVDGDPIVTFYFSGPMSLGKTADYYCDSAAFSICRLLKTSGLELVKPELATLSQHSYGRLEADEQDVTRLVGQLLDVYDTIVRFSLADFN